MTEHFKISEETRKTLEILREEDESFDALLQRMADRCRPMEAGVWEGTDKADCACAALNRTRDQF